MDVEDKKIPFSALVLQKILCILLVIMRDKNCYVLIVFLEKEVTDFGIYNKAIAVELLADNLYDLLIFCFGDLLLLSLIYIESQIVAEGDNRNLPH